MTRAEYKQIIDIAEDLTRAEWARCNRFCELNMDSADAMHQRTNDAVRFEDALNTFKTAIRNKFYGRLEG